MVGEMDEKGSIRGRKSDKMSEKNSYGKEVE